MSKRDYYEILGIQKNASADEIKSAFRRLARQYHPDVSKEAEAEEKFKEINEAYGILSDQQKRSQYDRFGHAGLGDAGGMNYDFTGDFSDLFEGLFGSFGFGGMGGSRSRNAPRRGRDLQKDITLDFDEAVFGVEKEIEFTRDEVCSTCNGDGAEPGTAINTCATCKGQGEVRQVRQTILGQVVQTAACPHCNGRGKTIETLCHTCRGIGLERKAITKKVKIPAGVEKGTQIRLGGEGQPGVNGGPRGNLYMVLNVKPHKFFQRRDDDILLNLDINIAQAVMGADIEVPTVDGSEKFSIPAGTQPGKVFKLRARGVPHLQRSGRGDQKIIINVNIPNKLSSEQREIFEQLAGTLDTEIKPQERGFMDWVNEVFGG
ncbi:MAG: molecular chaperone DnaJ [Anaerolineae bacterium]|nr:molecular chaperone DnaJ [Anaerolineae bacterium]